MAPAASTTFQKFPLDHGLLGFGCRLLKIAQSLCPNSLGGLTHLRGDKVGHGHASRASKKLVYRG